MGVAPASASWGNRLRASRPDLQQQAEAEAGRDWARSMLSTRDPSCTMPTADPCTLNTTAIGMVEAGYAVYYDGGCADKGYNGCFTDGIPECRTCYLSTSVYLENTNATEATLPNWGDCPCCVPTTLAAGHDDLEVNIFDYSIFNISVSECTDAPTSVPTLPPTAAPVPTSAPVVQTPAPTVLPVEATVSGVLVTPTPSTLAFFSRISRPTSISSFGVFDSAMHAKDMKDILSTGAKIGIGVGAAVGVIIVGGAVFGAFKASGAGSAD
eukprot:jgi/Undpi1/12552/HiC_scaffold_6.g02221.m1